MTQIASRIEAVKIYAIGATITRIAELAVTADLPDFVQIVDLPLALDDSTVRVRVEGDQGTVPIATDLSVGLVVPDPTEPELRPDEVALRAARAEVQRLQELLDLITQEVTALYRLQVPDRPTPEAGHAPPVSPLSARLALAGFTDEQVRIRMQEARSYREQLRLADEHLADLEQQQALVSTARAAKPHELRKQITVRLERQGDLGETQHLRLWFEYFVDGARWAPAYVCRLDSTTNQAIVAVRALICQQTGEDWLGARLELSTAQPLRWSTLPELPSRRIGRAQAQPRRLSWRPPPQGVELLFTEFDRQRQIAIATTRLPAVPQWHLPEVPVLPRIDSLLTVGATNEEAQDAEILSDEGDLFDNLESLNLYDNWESPNLYNVMDKSLERDLEDVEKALLGEVPGAVPAPQAKRMTFRSAMPPPAPMSAPPGRAVSATPIAEPSRSSQAMSPMEAVAVPESPDFLNYRVMRLGALEDREQRGKLTLESRQEAYRESLRQQAITLGFDPFKFVLKAQRQARKCAQLPLPSGGVDVRSTAGAFDYAYLADGRVDVQSDGQFHSIALTSRSAEMHLRYVVVPREDPNVFRIAHLTNPLLAPLLTGPVDIYVNGEYILSTTLATVPPQGQIELGLGVEQAIKVARNVRYEEGRSGNILVALNELRHHIDIDLVNQLPRSVDIEVRERIPVPQEGAKVEVQVDRVMPAWEKYEQVDRGAPIQGGYRWRVQVAARERVQLSTQYTVKTYADREIIGGNRREGSR